MSITEKEVATYLAEIFGEFEEDMRPRARELAELFETTLAPEKPEPGQYRVDNSGEYAVVSYNHGQKTLAVMGDDGTARFKYPSDEWPDLTPARVVAEAEMEEQRDFQRTLQREKAEWEANAEEANREIERLTARVAPAEPPVLTEEEVGKLWDQVTQIDAEWSELHERWHQSVTPTVNAALAKHGGARELPTRAEIMDAYTNGTMKVSSEDTMAIDRIMALLGGGDRG